jgi:hypothetical protein
MKLLCTPRYLQLQPAVPGPEQNVCHGVFNPRSPFTAYRLASMPHG